MEAAPSPGATLHGDPPAVGLRTLRRDDARETCPVVMVLLDCNPDIAVELVRVTAHADGITSQGSDIA
jgi:hypothetical protein